MLAIERYGGQRRSRNGVRVAFENVESDLEPVDCPALTMNFIETNEANAANAMERKSRIIASNWISVLIKHCEIKNFAGQAVPRGTR